MGALVVEAYLAGYVQPLLLPIRSLACGDVAVGSLRDDDELAPEGSGLLGEPCELRGPVVTARGKVR